VLRPSLHAGLPSANAMGQYRVFSKYRLIARLGSGGMAEVFLAVTGAPGGFNKLHVLKVLRSDLPEQERADFVRMFQDEGRLAARLNHPNIVQSYEVGSDEGHDFIAMEYLDGQPLSNIQERSWRQEPGFPLDMQLHVFCLVLEGLEYAHTLTDYGGRSLNIVHRDVSPQNVFVTYAGHTKLVDFGIAKTLESSKTRAGVVKGKVPYMSPEQVLGGAIDQRADLFSVGVMLWEAIAGRHMHGSASVYEILRRLVQGELPKIRDAVPDVPEALERILERVLSLKPDDRYADAAAFREDLASYLDGRPKVTTREIGQRVSQLFANERREINEVIRRAMTEATESDFDSGQLNAVHLLPTLQLLAERNSQKHDTGPTTAPTTVPYTTTPVQNTTPPPVQMATLSADSAARTGSKKTWLIAAGAIGVAALLAFALHSAADRNPTASAAGSAGAHPAGDARAPSATVRLNIRVDPPGAALLLDGKPLGKSPYSGTLAKDSASHEVQASATGYQTRVFQIQVDSDVDLVAELTEASRPSEAKPASSASSPSAMSPKKDALAPQSRTHAASAAPKKGNDAEPYRDLPTRKSPGSNVPPLDTSESPW